MVEGLYSIGQTAKRSGLSTHTIRKWEDRHGAVVPQRSAGGVRRYSETQVDRLVLVKHLVDAGHGISSIAAKETDELRQLRPASVLDRVSRLPALIRVAVIGPTLPVWFERKRARMPGLEILGDAAVADNEITADAAVIEIPSLDESAFAQIEQWRSAAKARCAVVAYRYASAETISSLTDETTTLLRMPVDVQEIAFVIETLLMDQREQPAPVNSPRRFAPSVLARVAATKPTLGCECPRHVAELVSALAEFEIYSGGCESKNAEDATLHRYLGSTAGQARALLEVALCTVAEHEGIPLAQWQAEHEAASGSRDSETSGGV